MEELPLVTVVVLGSGKCESREDNNARLARYTLLGFLQLSVSWHLSPKGQQCEAPGVLC